MRRCRRAAAHPGWEHGSALPVVEPGERLVGVLTRDALARALRRAARRRRAARDATLPVLLARGYWQALSGLLERRRWRCCRACRAGAGRSATDER